MSRYGPNGLLNDYYIRHPTRIFECNALCACGPACINRQVQLGPTLPLEVFHTPAKGCGLRCSTALPKGQFVIEYVGEIVTNREIEAKKLENPDTGLYSWELTPDTITSGSYGGTGARAGAEDGRDEPLVIDTSNIGNCARFVNHSCNPNLIGMEVYVDSQDYKRVAFFTRRKTRKDEELTIDYQYRKLAYPGVIMPCRCGSTSCDGVLY